MIHAMIEDVWTTHTQIHLSHNYEPRINKLHEMLAPLLIPCSILRTWSMILAFLRGFDLRSAKLPQLVGSPRLG